MKKITQERLRELCKYDPATGVFTHRITRYGRPAGSRCGSLDSNGYVDMSVDGVRTRAHRFAWLYIHGYLPENGIDHINRKPDDNRLCNLREATQQCNIRNKRIRSNNKSGITGVFLRNRKSTKDRWMVQIHTGAKTVHVGTYDTKLEAAMARWRAEKAHNYPDCNTVSSALRYIEAKTIEKIVREI